MNNHEPKLIWIGKRENPKLEQRIHTEDPAKSFGE